MPFLPDIHLSSIGGDDPQQQLQSVVAQLNEWGRMISNESSTRVIKSDSGVEAVTIGKLPNGENGIMIRDENDTPRALFGQLPDGTVGIVISKEGENVLDVFS